MESNVTRFTDAIYHRQDSYDFEETDFSRRMLKVFFLVDGNRTVTEISELLNIDPHTLMPEFANLVKIELIQTKKGIISAGLSGLFSSNKSASQFETTIA